MQFTEKCIAAVLEKVELLQQQISHTLVPESASKLIDITLDAVRKNLK